MQQHLRRRSPAMTDFMQTQHRLTKQQSWCGLDFGPGPKPQVALGAPGKTLAGIALAERVMQA